MPQVPTAQSAAERAARASFAHPDGVPQPPLRVISHKVGCPAAPRQRSTTLARAVAWLFDCDPVDRDRTGGEVGRSNNCDQERAPGTPLPNDLLHQVQATHCRQRQAWKSIWRDRTGKSWYIEACREHPSKTMRNLRSGRRDASVGKAEGRRNTVREWSMKSPPPDGSEPAPGSRNTLESPIQICPSMAGACCVCQTDSRHAGSSARPTARTHSRTRRSCARSDATPARVIGPGSRRLFGNAPSG